MPTDGSAATVSFCRATSRAYVFLQQGLHAGCVLLDKKFPRRMVKNDQEVRNVF